MNQVIQISISSERGGAGSGIQTVNARELHAFLESRQQFADWVRGRIDQYGFLEGQDYVIHKFTNNPGRPVIEYAVTLDMAKERAMVEHTEKANPSEVVA